MIVVALFILGRNLLNAEAILQGLMGPAAGCGGVGLVKIKVDGEAIPIKSAQLNDQSFEVDSVSGS